MNSIVPVFWDHSNFSSPEIGKHHLEKFFDLVIAYNKILNDYLGKDYIFQFNVNPESFIENNIKENTSIVFLLAELKQGKDPRTSFYGLRFLKLLRKNRIKIPIVLFSFLSELNDFDFCDKDDFFNPDFMQFFVRLPGIKLWADNDEQKPLSVLTDDELDELLNNQYDKKQKASFLLDKLLEDLKRIADDDKHKTMELIKNTFQSMIKWVPQKAGHAIYLTVLPNKLKRLQTQMQRIDLLEKYKHRLLEGIDIDHDGLAG